MRRISPVLVVLLAAGCANAGISDWINPFKMFGGKQGGGNPGAASSTGNPGVQHSPKSRGTRQLYSASQTQNNPHSHLHGPVPQPPIGSPPGALDDGFKPSFPPGFANPPNHSPNLNPFATIIGEGSQTNAKGPFLPSQLTQYHIPANRPHTPLAAPGPNPTHPPNSKSGGPFRHRGRFPFGGRGGRSRPVGGVPPHAAVPEGSSELGPAGPDPGNQVPLSEFPGLASPLQPPVADAQTSPAEYEETPTSRPESAPQRRPSFLARLRGIRQHSRGPRPSSYNGEQGRNPQSEGHGGNFGHGGGGNFGQGGGSNFGQGGPGNFGQEGGSNFGESGPGNFGEGGPPNFGEGGSGGFGDDSGGNFGNFGQGPPAGPPNRGVSFLQNSNNNGGPDPYINEGMSGGPSPLTGLGGLGGRPGVDAFYANSPGSNSPFAPVIPDQGPQGPSPFSNQQPSFRPEAANGPSPFANPQSFGRPGGSGPSGPSFGNGPSSGFSQGRPEGIFGSSGPGPRGPPPQGRPGRPGGRPNGPQSFFGNNGNDYPEQFEGGERGTRQQPQLSSDDHRPQPNGPPETPAGQDEQHGGFFGALHDSNSNPQLSSFFNDQQGGPPGPPPNNGGSSPFGGPAFGPAPGGFDGGHGQGFANHPRHHQHQHRPNQPRFSFRNPLAAFQGSASNLPSHGTPLLMSASGSKGAVSLPVPKGSRVLRAFKKKPAPKDSKYRPLSLGASSLNPISAPYEPQAAASGGHGGYGDVGLSHNGDRILYHVAGHKGPLSYSFGYATGKGYNRLFRFEEKDGKGFVKGKYGFYDKTGKLNVINYEAHPKHGFHAERGHKHGHY